MLVQKVYKTLKVLLMTWTFSKIRIEDKGCKKSSLSTPKRVDMDENNIPIDKLGTIAGRHSRFERNFVFLAI